MDDPARSEGRSESRLVSVPMCGVCGVVGFGIWGLVLHVRLEIASALGSKMIARSLLVDFEVSARSPNRSKRGRALNFIRTGAAADSFPPNQSMPAWARLLMAPPPAKAAVHRSTRLCSRR